MASKNKRPETTTKQIQSRFMSLFTVFALLIGFGVVSVVGVQLVRQRQQESVELLSSLKRSIIDDRPDWNQWRKSSTINTRDTFVRVHNSRIGEAPGTYYSKGTQDFLKAKKIHVLGFPALTYVSHYGFMYYRSGTRLGIRSEIWLSLQPMVAVLISVLMTVVIFLLLGLTIGSYLITLSAKQLTRPLLQLTNAAAKQSQDANDYASALPVPDNPLEVEQLASSFNQLLETVNQKSEQEKAFVSNAAHELRTPIAVILGHSKLIQRRGKSHPELVNHSVAFITDEATRMQRLVNQLLVLSRADRAKSERSYINLSDVVFETVEEERAVLSQRIAVTGDHSAVVYTNADNVQQILRTLLDNAGKYSPKGSLISVKIQTTDTKIILSVTDEGPGIKPEDQPRVFDRFYRGDFARDEHIQGTGLGLSIAKQLANLNQIELDVTSNQPVGTIFTLSFNNPKYQLS
ncbi:sensor histidine kinase [Secundilactobacillus folii]|uniref:histidine kinase n=1 Tax=Secundilactobacillus folii TaxID=2678357 RepID=A0A7X2XUI5_9LACO|nr:HAMP domain-containing sensor histidine kinase [Secundilactobacillus folii]MTV81874.1 HAMP domain-containing protein [Secundilactobacillus folii]